MMILLVPMIGSTYTILTLSTEASSGFGLLRSDGERRILRKEWLDLFAEKAPSETVPAFGQPDLWIKFTLYEDRECAAHHPL
jgi:hypothetical protein